MEARIQIERDGTVTDVVELVAERTLVGRARHCDVQLDDNKVSADHLEITRHGFALLATDLGSRNGTLLNGQRLTRPARLADGDTLALGGCRLRIGIRLPVETQQTELEDDDAEVPLTGEEFAVAAALVRPFRQPGVLAARPASRAEIAEVTHLAERTVTRRLETLARKLRLRPHEPRERPYLVAQRVLELGLDRHA